jgi:hypothetical protein
VFHDPAYTFGLSWPRIMLFRQHLNSAGFFRYWYVGLANSLTWNHAEIYSRLRELGVRLEGAILIGSSNQVVWKELHPCLEFVCSPELLKSFPIPNHRMVDEPEPFLEALVHFQSSMEPYSRDAFLKKFEEFSLNGPAGPS